MSASEGCVLIATCLAVLRAQSTEPSARKLQPNFSITLGASGINSFQRNIASGSGAVSVFVLAQICFNVDMLSPVM